MAKRALQVAAVVLAALLLLGLGLLVASERMEVVVLASRDASGAAHETRLWIVDSDDSTWLRCGSSERDWLARVRANPEVELRRGGTLARFRAVVVDDPAVAARVDELMREKYGVTDLLIQLLEGRPQGVPVRLVPRVPN